jgi:hypothetical protein
MQNVAGAEALDFCCLSFPGLKAGASTVVVLAHDAVAWTASPYMLAIMRVANSLVLTLVAPCIWRSKS